MIWKLLSLALMILCGVLLLKLNGIRRSLGEIAGSLREKLHEETNTPITVASSDPAVCRLAAELNRQLRTLRSEQLRLQNGSHELQNAITNAAHDLRTPLTAVSGYLELLEQEQLGEKASQYASVIRERTEALKGLTEELFRYSVADTASDALHPETLSLNDELEIALAAAYQVLSVRGISPEIHIPERQVTRVLDRNATQRIFSNILNNAAKYSAGTLTVSLAEDGTVTFTNPAPSLSNIEVGRLFERFYTVENAEGSTGLGLSIAKLLTEKIGGVIHAEYRDGYFNITLRFADTGNMQF